MQGHRQIRSTMHRMEKAQHSHTDIRHAHLHRQRLPPLMLKHQQAQVLIPFPGTALSPRELAKLGQLLLFPFLQVIVEPGPRGKDRRQVF